LPAPTTPRDEARPARRFIRHTADVPLEIRTLEGETRHTRGLDVGHGGLSFRSGEHVPIGSTIAVRIPDVDPPFEAGARVVWCRAEGDAHRIGVAFLDASDAFRARMVEQVCEIDRYRDQMLAEEGRELSRDEAAAEWIGRHARRFPGASDPHASR
jgi:hypothetical protein